MCNESNGLSLDFCSIQALIGSFLPESLSWLAFLFTAVTLSFLVINALVLSTALYTWFERRTLGRFQARLGPNRWGPFGLFQPIADLLKLISKEDLIPDQADRIVFSIAPVVFLVPVLLVVSIVPFGDNSFLGRLNIGVLFIIAVTGLNTIAIFMGGWASRNKYAMLGAMRGVAMLVSYEIPMALAITGIVLTSGSLALTTIVNSQSVLFALVQPIGFFVFFVASIAEMSRAPFDQIEAESELGSGYHTEYSGMKYAIFQLAEFMAPIVTAIIITTLYLGGTRGFDPIPGQLWFVLKVFLVVFLMLWFRATWPRLRIDQIMSFAWKALFGLALFNLVLLTIEVQLLQDGEGKLHADDLWIMSAINWSVAVLVFVMVAVFKSLNRREVNAQVPSTRSTGLQLEDKQL